MAHDVFVSYSSRDKITADAVVARLEAARLRCWIGPRDILPGMEWGEAIVEGIYRARVMVLVFSSSANSSPQIRREVERAVNRGIPIIPFRIEEVLPSRALEYFLSSPHWLDALTPPVERHIQKLADSVRALLTRMEEDETVAAPKPSPSTGRIRVQKVIDTMLGRAPRLATPGHVPGLAAAPASRRPGARPPRPPAPAPMPLMIGFGALLAIAVAALFLTRSPAVPSPAPARPATPSPTAAAQRLPAIRPAAQAPAPNTAAAAASAPAAAPPTKTPHFTATYECRRGVKFSIDPDRATVSIDGRRIGVAEDFYHHAYELRPGTHYAKISLQGYRTEYVRLVVRLSADENTDVKLTLHRAY